MKKVIKLCLCIAKSEAPETLSCIFLSSPFFFSNQIIFLYVKSSQILLTVYRPKTQFASRALQSVQHGTTLEPRFRSWKTILVQKCEKPPEGQQSKKTQHIHLWFDKQLNDQIWLKHNKAFGFCRELYAYFHIVEVRFDYKWWLKARTETSYRQV